MSESKADGVGDQKTENSVDGSKKDQVSYETYSRTLDEAKRAKSKLSELESKLKDLEDKELQAKGALQELADKKAKEAEDLRNALKEERAQRSWESMSFRIKNAATKAGCIDSDALIKIGPGFESVFTDDKTDLNDDDIEKIIKTAKEKTAYLFIKPVSQAKTVTAGFEGHERITKDSLNKLSSKQIVELLNKKKFSIK